MKVYENEKGVEIHHGECFEVLKGMPESSVDSIVTDPPYGLSFMGKKWDCDVPSEEIWRECLRVLKPGGYLLAFAGTRTQHRMAVRIEDAGFEIRDMIAWVYGSGFPKSLDVSKAIDKAAGVEREVVGTVDPRGTFDGRERASVAINTNWRGAEGREDVIDMSKKSITAPATDAAKQWQGWGTALKPAFEPLTVARKPLIGTVAANVLAHGTGGLNIDGCRVKLDGDYKCKANGRPSQTGLDDNYKPEIANQPDNLGRWPANLIHDGSDEVVACFPDSKSTGGVNGGKLGQSVYGKFKNETIGSNAGGLGDQGSAARFFYCAKASKSDRDDGCGGLDDRILAMSNQAGAELERGNMHKGESGMNTAKVRKNNHPTVKPTDLMRYLCRLVTQPGGIVLDPFMGSGSTGKAAVLEGFGFIGIEKEAAYCEIASKRIEAAERQPQQGKLFDAASFQKEKLK